MKLRKKTSGGQAIVMVTLSLTAMAGLMGLAVDLGWSYFVQKEAQTAADGAAMAAVQEAFGRLDGVFGSITCGMTGPTGKIISCQSTPAACSTLSAPNNLYDGCLYANINGFTSGAARQQVTIQADVGANALPPGTFGLDKRNVPYWVRAVAVQTVPQLFSAVLGHMTSTVAASAVAGITGNAVPGNLVLLNQQDDCFDPPGSTGVVCGENINLASCFLCNLSAAGPIYMASTCHGTAPQTAGCGNSVSAKGTNYAGINGFGDSVTGSVIDVQNPGNVTGGGFNPTPQQKPANSIFLDPTSGEAQPPLTANAPVPSCGVFGGQLSGTVGPYSYYAYSSVNPSTHKPIANGNPILINGNVTFSASSTRCPTHGSDVNFNAAGATAQSSGFPTYLFYGGLIMNSTISLTSSFGPGEYVLVGTNNTATGNCAGSVLCIDSAVSLMSGDTNSGTMFIATSPQAIVASARYPGLDTQITTNASLRPEITAAAAAASSEGNVNIQSLISGSTFTGVVQGGTAPSSLNQYNGVAFWQDRANSTVQYDATGHVIGATNPTQPPSGANSMNIAGLIAGVNVNGVIYQPRGAYITDAGFIAGVNVSVQIISGALYLNGALTGITLGTPTHQLTTFTASMIQ